MNNVMLIILILEQTLTAMIEQGMEEGSHLAHRTMDVEEEEAEVGHEKEVDLEMELVE